MIKEAKKEGVSQSEAETVGYPRIEWVKEEDKTIDGWGVPVLYPFQIEAEHKSVREFARFLADCLTLTWDYLSKQYPAFAQRYRDEVNDRHDDDLPSIAECWAMEKDNWVAYELSRLAKIKEEAKR